MESGPEVFPMLNCIDFDKDGLVNLIECSKFMRLNVSDP